MPINVHFEDVKVGDEIPAWSRKTDFMNWNRYAAVNDEFVYIHMDDEGGRKAGMKAAFGMGNLRFAYMHDCLRQWIGINGDIKRVEVQYRAINYKNDVLTTRGKVTRKYRKDGLNLVDLEIWVENQEGAVTAPGKATVALPSRGRR